MLSQFAIIIISNMTKNITVDPKIHINTKVIDTFQI